jgi:parallel beta-helix repeat protein
MPVEDKTMKNPKRILTGFVATLWMFMGTDVMGQGSLTPPGAPGETMKTLAQVEPRTPISSLPYTISEPGSYYVTGNLSSTTNGIVIESSGVTVDLMGFSLRGDGTSSYPDYDYGIHVISSTNAVIENLVVKGGRISGFYGGLYCQSMNNSRIEGLVVSDNTEHGVSLNDSNSGHCNGNTIADCTISGNGDKGVYLNGREAQCNGNTIADCTISDNGNDGVYLFSSKAQCNGNTIADCTISGNGYYGVRLYGGSSSQCNGNTITDCTISENGDKGVYLYGYGGQCNGNTIADCTISENGDKGVYLYGYGGQCNGNTITDCTISENGDKGVYLYGYGGQCNGNTIADCTISENGGYGVDLLGQFGQCNGNTIRENTVSRNSSRGISIYRSDGNRVEANTIWGTTGEGDTYGIRTALTTSNFILKNTCVGNGTNYELDSDDTFGPIVTSSGALSGTDPWANFSR